MSASSYNPVADVAVNSRPRKVLLLAESGGHLAELVEWADRMPTLRSALWMTPDTPQSRQLLSGLRHVDVPSVRPRDLLALRRASVVVRDVMRREQIDFVLSTGAGVALAALPQAAHRGIEAHYIESAARVSAPSLTGRLLSIAPGVRLWTQYPKNARGRWSYIGSVFEQFEVRTRTTLVPDRLRVVVTLGTQHTYGFDRLISRLMDVLPADADVTWQVGSIGGANLPPGSVRPWISPDELDELMARADVVVAHAGVGSAIGAMRSGAFPILVPRRARHGEHVDDHQQQVGAHLAALGLAYCVEVDDVTPDLFNAVQHLRLHTREKLLPLTALADSEAS